jgi:hypothetical protein
MLLAYFYRRTFDDASMVVLPQQRWDDWRKVNERISIEAAVLPPEKFLDEVPKPTEAQIKAFYEQHKDADPGLHAMEGGRELPIATPGFASPRRVRVQYLLGSSTRRAEQMLEKVTEEEIKDYYERNKRLEFTKLDLPGEESFGSPEDAAPAATPGAGETQTSPPAEEAAAEEPPAEAAPAAEPAAPAASETPAVPAPRMPKPPARRRQRPPMTPRRTPHRPPKLRRPQIKTPRRRRPLVRRQRRREQRSIPRRPSPPTTIRSTNRWKTCVMRSARSWPRRRRSRNSSES